jgi:hypothetical protein
MKRTKPTATKVAVEKAPTRYVPDPHRRHRIVESSKIYSRKARPKVGPSDFPGVRRILGEHVNGDRHPIRVDVATARRGYAPGSRAISARKSGPEPRMRPRTRVWAVYQP